jgi:hypothetical protein
MIWRAARSSASIAASRVFPQRGFAAIKENQKIKRQKSLRRAAGRIGEELSGAGRNQTNRQ